ncbi:MAG: biopolymer transporter ExbD [Candidatus Pelagadaptatus aseana]|uniref:ExbD/TolR family protein n=1 Tax=Candidatus Pelagadaptatus aseana TaxID=3120508 RepID=UPI0039B1BA28
MKFKRQTKEEESINLTPLIDVVFLLLIFFMVSTTFTKETHLKVDLPEAVGEPGIKQSEPLEILISAQGDYSVNGKALVNNQMKTLKKALLEVSQGQLDQPLIITADAKTPHQAVVTAMDAAGQAGFVHLSMTTRKPAEEE